MNYTLPTSVNVGGRELKIRSDFRVILEIIQMLQDPDLDKMDKAEAMVTMFYEDPEQITDPNEAIKECFNFIDQGEKSKKKTKKLVDWEQDFPYIIAPINRVLGYDARGAEYLHWWTFMAAYMEIGSDCLFSQIVTIRDKQARGKTLEKYEREWLRRNQELVLLKQHYSESEEELLSQWIGG